MASQASAQGGRTDTTHKLPEAIFTYHADFQSPVSFQNIIGSRLKELSVGQEPSSILSANTPSITAYSDAGNTQGYSYYRLRGIDQTRINATIDGVPMNEPEDQGAYFSNFPDMLNSARSIQLVNGAGISRNGTAAFGGSLEILPPDLTEHAGTTIGAGYGSFNTYRIFVEENTGVKHGKAIYARGSYLHSDGYKYHSDNTGSSAFVSAAAYGKQSSWRLNLMIGHQQNGLAWIGVSDSLVKADPRTNANSHAERDAFTTGFVQVKNTWAEQGSRWHLTSSVYYTFLDGHYSFDLAGYLGLPPDSTLYDYAFHSNGLGFFSVLGYAKSGLSLNAGIHGNVYNRRHIGSERTLGQLYINTGYKDEASCFAKAEWQRNGFILFADVQCRYASFYYNGVVAIPRLSWTFLNPNAGISYRIANSTFMYYSLAVTGREPTRNDMFGGSDDMAADSLGSPLLSNTRAEYVTDHELGLRRMKGDNSISINGYYMRFSNEIVLNGKLGPNGLSLSDNVSQSYRCGIEISLQHAFNKHLTAGTHASVNYSRIKEAEVTFTPLLTPGTIINQTLMYAIGKARIELSGRYQSSAYLDFANRASVPDYFLLNVAAQYRISSRFEVSLFANNLTNTQYYNNGYVDEAGRTRLFVQSPFNFYWTLKCHL